MQYSYYGPSWKDLKPPKWKLVFLITPPTWVSKCLGDRGRDAQKTIVWSWSVRQDLSAECGPQMKVCSGISTTAFYGLCAGT